jgi:hypothetical protein
MASQTLTQSHQSSPALPGTWKLAAGRAVTLQPREPGLLRIAHGSVWATFDGPHAGPLNDLGDRFLHPGEQLTLGRGQRLVIEAGDSRGPAFFSWDPLPQVQRQRVSVAELVQPLSDLRHAIVLGAGAAGRLVMALGRLAWGTALPQRKSLEDCCANGAMS